MKIVLARTRYMYGSYTYFWKLAELSGFPICYVDEIDLDADAAYVMTPANGEWVIDGRFSPGFQAKFDALGTRPRRARLVWWYIERPGGEFLNDPAQAPAEIDKAIAWSRGRIDRVWTHDRYFASMSTDLLPVPIGSDSRLRAGDPIRPYRYDVCHFLYVNHRRSRILAGLAEAGLRVAPSDWNDGRNGVWNSSKLCLSLHQSEIQGGEQLRFAAAAAWGVPLVSETMADPWPLERGKEILEFPYRGLVAGVARIAKEDLGDLGRALQRKLCEELTFRKCIEEGISRSFAEAP